MRYMRMITISYNGTALQIVTARKRERYNCSIS